MLEVWHLRDLRFWKFSGVVYPGIMRPGLSYILKLAHLILSSLLQPCWPAQAMISNSLLSTLLAHFTAFPPQFSLPLCLISFHFLCFLFLTISWPLSSILILPFTFSLSTSLSSLTLSPLPSPLSHFSGSCPILLSSSFFPPSLFSHPT